MRASHDSRETFVRVSHDVRANFKQFYFSQLKSRNGLIYVAYLSCRIVQIAEISLRCVCERLRRVGDGFATYAMTWRRFCDVFCRTKKFTCLKLWRTVRDEFIFFIFLFFFFFFLGGGGCYAKSTFFQWCLCF